MASRGYSMDNVMSSNRIKSYDYTCNNTLARICDVIEKVCVKKFNAFSYFLIIIHFEAEKIPF